jgi:dolichol-phosphate mannosyltransferase
MLEETAKKITDLDKLLTVVIPTLNEEEGLGKVLEELHAFGVKNVLVVDGYSTDKTVEIAKQHGARVVYQHGKGKTGAIKVAIDQVNTPYMLIMDGDFTYDASSIPRFVQHIGAYDEVIGARVSNGKSMTRLHKFGNEMITRAFNVLMNTMLSDVCSGMYLLKTDAAREVHLETTGFDVEAEIAAQIASAGSITEIPVNYRTRLGRQKLSTWKHGFRIISSIFQLARSYNPGVFYSMLGSLMVVPAGLMLFSSGMQYMYTGKITSNYFFIGVAVLLVAIQAMSVGVISLILRRTELRTARMLRKILNS